MLRALLIASAGIVLFEKSWVQFLADGDKLRLFGGLFTGIEASSRQALGAPVTYLEFSTLAVTLHEDTETGLVCVVFHDASDGYAFGKMITTQILSHFIDEYSGSIDFKGTTPNVAVFQKFHNKLVEVIHSSINAVLQQLETVRGIRKALYVSDDEDLAQGQELETVANLQPIIKYADSLMNSSRTASGENAREIMIEWQQKLVYVKKLVGCSEEEEEEEEGNREVGGEGEDGEESNTVHNKQSNHNNNNKSSSSQLSSPTRKKDSKSSSSSSSAPLSLPSAASSSSSSTSSHSLVCICHKHISKSIYFPAILVASNLIKQVSDLVDRMS